MLRLFVSSVTAMSPPSSRFQPPNRLQNPNPNPNTSSTCNHSPSATLDLILLLLVLSSLAFLLASSLAHIGRSLSSFLSPLAAAIGASPLYHLAAPLILLLLFVLILAAAAIALSCRCRRRRLCRNPQCLGLKQALEFDVQLQTEESIRDCGGGDLAAAASWKEIDELPWKGGQGGNNPDYECVRAELRKLAPPNGRAVLLFRARCGCPITKLEAWGPKRGRRHKKGASNLALEGGER